ncbi:hypothetical protein MGG_15892 [Pyricularia oryzae 70-15]|uniref:Uncharacterized protein n=3 Tax=Pyricularia oryzae TaxID=318829 RepID=G4MUK0_PYRO7|nr:uncharacterized protein MGG_15892 [Pyricularia oryzae 70-15]EHA55692.1 hypothetical protein MGG_15892 [Pyricularia oryzae 70-15]ELQ37392.1 hypothetical protein OOU_Y34scaffold00597g18 [Pyricularia oryzae Y34]
MALHPSYRRQLSKLREGYLGSFFYQIDTQNQLPRYSFVPWGHISHHSQELSQTVLTTYELSKNRVYAKPEQKINNERL